MRKIAICKCRQFYDELFQSLNRSQAELGIFSNTIATQQTQVGVISRRLNNTQGKTQPIMKFFIYHSMPKNPERVFPETRKVFFLH